MQMSPQCHGGAAAVPVVVEDVAMVNGLGGFVRIGGMAVLPNLQRPR